MKEAGALIDVKEGEEVVKIEEKWKAIEEGCYKINCDGGFKKKKVRRLV